jgi:mono/diheme cytochrome c family protein
MKSAASKGGLAALFVASLMIGVPPGAGAAGEPSAEAKPAEAAPAPEKPKIDVRKLFATNCSWCHQDYGMKAADGPKLAGTHLTEEQVIEQISKGKSPMPGFRKSLSREQIEALAKYIKGLKDPDAK